MSNLQLYNKHVHYNKNTIGRDFIVGDIHGCIKDLLHALTLLDFNESADRLFSVGDLVDRGPDSFGSANLIYEPWFICVKGNHEDLLVGSIINKNNSSFDCWINNGGQWSIEADKQLLEDVANKMAALPLVISVGTGIDRFNIVHAELTKRDTYYKCFPVTDAMIDNWEFNDSEEDDMMWGRTIAGVYQMSPADGNSNTTNKYHDPILLSPTYVGHTPQTTARRVEQHIYIDTGAVYYHTSRNKDPSTHLTIAEPNKKLLHRYYMEGQDINTISIDEIAYKGA